MPHSTEVARRATVKLNGLPNEELRGELQPVLQSATGLRDAVERLGLLTDLDSEVVEDATVLLDAVPSGLASALLAAVSDSVDRNVPVTVVWQAAYDFELRVWESVASDGVGGMTVMLSTPFPRHVVARLDVE
jgi:hypothetical protein